MIFTDVIHAIAHSSVNACSVDVRSGQKYGRKYKATGLMFYRPTMLVTYKGMFQFNAGTLKEYRLTLQRNHRSMLLMLPMISQGPAHRQTL